MGSKNNKPVAEILRWRLESTGQTFAEVTASGEQDGNSQP